jgi:hypothetical protein
MSIEVFNPTQVKRPVLRTKDLEPGSLYKSTDEDGNLEPYDTIYFKTFNGTLLFAQEGVLNEEGDTEGYYFVVAPEGTYVTLK